MQPWDFLLKQMLWKQLEFVQNMKVLDFGSGEGDTAAHLSEWNDVTAVEPSAAMLANRTAGPYVQVQGGIERVQTMQDASFDVVVCHNVLEYVNDKELYIRELARVVKPGGYLSLVKHNRSGRVMQMTVLLNDFVMANTLLDGGEGKSGQFGDIRYYEDEDIRRWLPAFACEHCWGARTFWDLQQRQECHTDLEWQKQMLALEERVSVLPHYQNIAFFHHLLMKKADD